ncbi:MAG: DNA-3-methyladenine glycosylase I [Planctomycetia bacterium]|nr:DNA-3-methyladenine glycosylase I [Planctomycetia bacterium]
MPSAKKRCLWPGADPLMIEYHDREWGVPVHDDQKLFEHLILDGAQAGLSWRTILHKRAAYREAFANFDVVKVARFTPSKIERLLLNPGIVRNRLKVTSAVRNAKAFLKVQDEFDTFDKYLWQFVGGGPIHYRRQVMRDIPATSPESDAMSKDLKRRGFNFVGSTICYAMMQAAGLVNDHLVDCFRHRDLVKPGKRRG